MYRPTDPPTYVSNLFHESEQSYLGCTGEERVMPWASWVPLCQLGSGVGQTSWAQRIAQV